MKIGFNVKIIKDTLEMFEQSINYLGNKIIELENKSGSEWVEITSANGQEAEITQEFSEIRMLASVYDTQNIAYSFSCNYDSNIFHNSTTRNDEYFITGNPIANNYGCKFKYYVSGDGKQYITVDSCYNGNNTVDSTLKVWIKKVPTGTQ